jgi:CRP-like cAMP-binding protein
MDEFLGAAELFQGLSRDEVAKLSTIGTSRAVPAGDYLFRLGDDAQDFYVVTRGSVSLCFPIPFGEIVKDISIESAVAGEPLGWSALVKPYRFTLSARATEPSEVLAFARRDLLQLFDAEPWIARVLLTRIAELVGIRLLTFQALWMRELQRALATEAQRRPE